MSAIEFYLKIVSSADPASFGILLEVIFLPTQILQPEALLGKKGAEKLPLYLDLNPRLSFLLNSLVITLVFYSSLSELLILNFCLCTMDVSADGLVNTSISLYPVH